MEFLRTSKEPSLDAGAKRRLEEKLDRLALITRAMFELMQEAGGLSDERLTQKVLEIDLRDGQQDNRMSPRPKRCPKCDAMISPKFARCVFCGYRDEAPGAYSTRMPLRLLPGTLGRT